jgi:predicted transcriptional regulator
MKIGFTHSKVFSTAVSATLLVFLLIVSGMVSAQGSSIVGEVADASSNDPVLDAHVTVAYSENNTVVSTTTTDSDGYFEVNDLPPGSYRVTISAQGFIEHSELVEVEPPTFHENTYFLDVKLNPLLGMEPQEEESEDTPIILIFQILAVVSLILIVTLVMYSKIKRENLLKNAIRKRIFEYIRDNPGFHYRAILNDLELSMGVLTYHLNRLEKANYIKSRQDGMFRRFYVAGRKTDMRLFLSDIQESILTVIKENRGISQSKIAEKISVSRKVVNYHVNILNQAGLIFVESHGRESACFPTESSAPEVDSAS